MERDMRLMGEAGIDRHRGGWRRIRKMWCGQSCCCVCFRFLRICCRVALWNVLACVYFNSFNMQYRQNTERFLSNLLRPTYLLMPATLSTPLACLLCLPCFACSLSPTYLPPVLRRHFGPETFALLSSTSTQLQIDVGGPCNI